MGHEVKRRLCLRAGATHLRYAKVWCYLNATAKCRTYLQRVIRRARNEAIPEPLISWLPQDVAQLAVQVLFETGTDKVSDGKTHALIRERGYCTYS